MLQPNRKQPENQNLKPKQELVLLVSVIEKREN
jgi:hypothetical protein